MKPLLARTQHLERIIAEHIGPPDELMVSALLLTAIAHGQAFNLTVDGFMQLAARIWALTDAAHDVQGTPRGNSPSGST